MERWEDLKVYRLLPPDEIPKAFKLLAKQLTENLQSEGFILKESKTTKQIFRILNDLQQSIYIDNCNPYEKNQKEIKIKIEIKPTFTNYTDFPYWLFDAYQLGDKSIKMGYVLSQHNSLLLEHLTRKFKTNIIPLFNKISSSIEVVKHHLGLTNINDYANREVENLLMECAFKNRDKILFLAIIDKRINEASTQYNKVSSNHEYAFEFKRRLDQYLNLKNVFIDDNLYYQESLSFVKKQDKYVNSLLKRKL